MTSQISKTSLIRLGRSAPAQQSSDSGDTVHGAGRCARHHALTAEERSPLQSAVSGIAGGGEAEAAPPASCASVKVSASVCGRMMCGGGAGGGADTGTVRHAHVEERSKLVIKMEARVRFMGWTWRVLNRQKNSSILDQRVLPHVRSCCSCVSELTCSESRWVRTEPIGTSTGSHVDPDLPQHSWYQLHRWV